MKKFLKIQSEIFGLDINDLSIKIVKLKEKNGSFVLSSIGWAEVKPGIIENGVIKDEVALADIIKKACKSVKGEKLDTKYVVVSLPEERSFLQVIKMPKMDEKELKSAAIFEVENYIPLSVENIYVDFQKISEENMQGGNMDVLIVAMPRPIVDSYISCLEKAGLTPYILEVESLAIARALIKKDITTPTAIIDLGKNNTGLIIFSGNSIRFTCSINIGSQQITNTIATALKVDPVEAEKMKISSGVIPEASKVIFEDLATQVKKYLDFYFEHFFHDHPSADSKVEKIILCGGGANLKGLEDFFTKKLNVPVEVSSVPKNILPKNKNSDPVYEIIKKSPSFITALGLAERGSVEGKEYPHI